MIGGHWRRRSLQQCQRMLKHWAWLDKCSSTASNFSPTLTPITFSLVFFSCTYEFCIVLMSVLIVMLDMAMITETWKPALTISWRKRDEGNINILIMSFNHLFLLIYIAQQFVFDLLNAVRESQGRKMKWKQSWSQKKKSERDRESCWSWGVRKLEETNLLIIFVFFFKYMTSLIFSASLIQISLENSVFLKLYN